MAIFRTVGVAGGCHGALTLGRMSVSMVRKSVCKFVKRGNTNGAAVVHLLAKLTRPAANGVTLFNRDGGGLTGRHRHVNYVVRDPSLCLSVATCRGLRMRHLRHNVPKGNYVSGTLTLINLGSAKGGGTGSFSLNVQRELTLTVTLLKGPRFLMLSRPVGKLSPAKVVRLEGLLGELGGRHKVAVLVSDRVLARLRRLTGECNVLRRKGLLRRVATARLSGHYGGRLLLRIGSMTTTDILLRDGLGASGFSIVPSGDVRLCSCIRGTKGMSTLLDTGGVAVCRLTRSKSDLRACCAGLVKKYRGSWPFWD